MSLNRREFLGGALRMGAIFTGITVPTSISAQNILSESVIEQFVLRGLDNSEVMQEFRGYVEEELRIAYRNNRKSGYPPFNSSDIFSDAVFFGNVKGDVSNQIAYDREHDVLYDARIKGRIDFNSPENILAKISNRAFSLEQGGDIAFILKDQYGTDIFVYYEGGKLKYVFPTTTGSEDTPDNMIVRGGFHREKGISFNNGELANYYNIKGRKGPMPYSRRLSTIDANGDIHYEGINTHIGNVAPSAESHGCARQAGFGASILYHTLRHNTLVYHRPDIYLDPENPA